MALPSTFTNAAEVTPHDTNANDFEALYVGGAGTLRVTTEGDQVVNFAAVPAGSYVYLRVRKVHSTGTSATSIIGLR